MCEKCVCTIVVGGENKQGERKRERGEVCVSVYDRSFMRDRQNKTEEERDKREWERCVNDRSGREIEKERYREK